MQIAADPYIYQRITLILAAWNGSNDALQHKHNLPRLNIISPYLGLFDHGGWGDTGASAYGGRHQEFFS